MKQYKKSNTKCHCDTWQVGGVYYRESGEKPFMIVDLESTEGLCSKRSYTAIYCGQDTRVHDYKEYLILAIETDDTNPYMEKEDTMTKLYQVKGQDVYGYILATNSLGKQVFETKGTGAILTFDKSEIEEVIPYSVSVKFSGTGQEYDYFSHKGDLEVGDIIFGGQSNDYMVVFGIDTKSTKATKWITGSVVKADKALKGE